MVAGCAGLAAVAAGATRPWQQDAASAKVTLTLQAMPLRQVLQQLQGATGVQFAASKGVASDVVCMRLVDVPLPEALDQICKAVDGFWRADGGVIHVDRSSEQLRAERDAEYALDLARIKTAIRQEQDQLSKLPAWSNAEAEALAQRADDAMSHYVPLHPDPNWYRGATELTQEAPVGRIMAEIATQLEADELASLPMFYKTVWSSNPTQMQRPLPQGLIPIIREFIESQAEWIAAVDRHNLRNSATGMGNYWAGGFGDSSALSPAAVATVLLSADRYGPGTDIRLVLSAYDAQGKLLGEAQMSLSGRERATVAQTAGGDASASEPEIPLDADERALQLAYSRRGASVPIPGDLLAMLSNPVQNDPLGLTVSPELIQIAEAQKLNLVACLPDNSIFAGLRVSGTAFRASKYLESLRLYDTDAAVKDGWLAIKPARPNQARLWRADRIVLGQYLQRLLTGKALSLDELAHFAANLPEAQLNYLPAAMATCVHAHADAGPGSREMLRLYGMLSGEQVQRMAGGGLPISSLTEAEQDLVGRMIYGPNSSIQLNQDRIPPAKAAERQAQWLLFNNGIMHQATEALPNGIPPEGRIHMRAGSSTVVMESESDGFSPGAISRVMNPQALAWAKFSQERPDLFPWVNQPGQTMNFSSMEYGSQAQLTFTFDLSPNLLIVQSLSGRAGGDFQQVTLDSLPDDFKASFNSAYDQLKKAYANSRPGLGTGAPPP